MLERDGVSCKKLLRIYCPYLSARPPGEKWLLKISSSPYATILTSVFKTPMMKYLYEVVDSIQLLSIFAKKLYHRFWLGFKYTFDTENETFYMNSHTNRNFTEHVVLTFAGVFRITCIIYFLYLSPHRSRGFPYFVFTRFFYLIQSFAYVFAVEISAHLFGGLPLSF